MTQRYAVALNNSGNSHSLFSQPLYLTDTPAGAEALQAIAELETHLSDNGIRRAKLGPLTFTVKRYITDEPTHGLPSASAYLASALYDGAEVVVQAPTGTGKTRWAWTYTEKTLLLVPYTTQARQLGAEGWSAWYGGQHGDCGAEKIVATYDKLPDVLEAMGDAAKLYTLIIDEVHEIVNSVNYRAEAVVDVVALRQAFRAVAWMSATPDKLIKYLDKTNIKFNHVKISPVHKPARTYTRMSAKRAELESIIVQAHQRRGRPVAVLYNDRGELVKLKRALVKMGAARPNEVAIVQSGSQPTDAERHIEERGTWPVGIKFLLCTKKISSGLNIAGKAEAVVVDNLNNRAQDVVQFAGRFRGEDVHTTFIQFCTYRIDCRTFEECMEHLKYIKITEACYKSKAEMLKALCPEYAELLRGGVLAAFNLSERAHNRFQLEEGLTTYLQGHEWKARAVSYEARELEAEVAAHVKAATNEERSEALMLLEADPARAIGIHRAARPKDIAPSNYRAVALMAAVPTEGPGLEPIHDKLCSDYVDALELLEHEDAIKVLKTWERPKKAMRAIRYRVNAREVLARTPTDKAEKALHDYGHVFEPGKRYTRLDIESMTAKHLLTAGIDPKLDQFKARALERDYWTFAHIFWTFRVYRERRGDKTHRVYEAVAYCDPSKLATENGLLELNCYRVNSELPKEKTGINPVTTPLPARLPYAEVEAIT